MTSVRTSSPVLDLLDLSVAFGKGQRDALARVCLTLESGRLVLVGESGAGKSTLLRVLAGLVVPSSGSVRVRGLDPFAGAAELRTVRQSLGIVLQEPRSSLHPMRSALESVAEPLLVLGGVPKRHARERGAEMLERVGIDRSRFSGRPGQLSGGECQRIALARALVRPVSLLLADESTANLDPHIASEVLALVASMTAGRGGQEGQTLPSLVWVTHRLPEALFLGGTVAVLWGGRVVELFTGLTSWETALHPYTRRLVQPATFTLNSARSGRTGACTYRPLCPWGADCRYETPPPLTPVSPNHSVACWKITEEKRL